MRVCGVKLNAVTFTRLFSACCHANLVEEGLGLFDNMKSKCDLEPNLQHYGCIVDLLGRAGHLNEAYKFIMGMPIKPNAILWRSLLSACKRSWRCRDGSVKRLRFSRKMARSGEFEKGNED
ncbi:hypothetical protein EZV62_027396 [Acer yangbiense]|uniref:Pentacotripeptide-repeat region of PRORP domain-containing protein n=1 Tax=Acer yangbiense TaxID=1000413 RepID=A0A5C7GUT7_9ROSI|nr:hypothetical protein EZV62_027396 [Acer yangbiense]